MPPVDERPCRIMGGRGVALNLMIFYSVYEKGHALCMSFFITKQNRWKSLLYCANMEVSRKEFRRRMK